MNREGQTRWRRVKRCDEEKDKMRKEEMKRQEMMMGENMRDAWEEDEERLQEERDAGREDEDEKEERKDVPRCFWPLKVSLHSLR